MLFTIQSFTYFFWILGGIILLMLIFEDKLLALEAEYDRKKEAKKRAASKTIAKKAAVKTSERKSASTRVNNSYKNSKTFNAA